MRSDGGAETSETDNCWLELVVVAVDWAVVVIWDWEEWELVQLEGVDLARRAAIWEGTTLMEVMWQGLLFHRFYQFTLTFRLTRSTYASNPLTPPRGTSTPTAAYQ